MDGFDHLLNWKLKVGSHHFPGPDGGTCINEAAIVAAGFEYRPIVSVEHMPECFSRPICRLAMLLNDQACEEERQRLLPYVTRLACADTPEIEQQREVYIRRHMGCCYVGMHVLGIVVLSFERALRVLDGALAIGRQADPLGPDEVLTRMDAARADRSKSFLSKVTGWLTSKEPEPAT